MPVAPTPLPYIKRKYGVFDEFRADTGSSRHARRLDALAIKSLTISERNTIRLYGVEIKVSVGDLKGDKKMAEIAFTWLFLILRKCSQLLTMFVCQWGVLAVNQTGSVRDALPPCWYPGLFGTKQCQQC